MRKELVRIGMAAAMVTSAAACKKETNSATDNSFTVAPGECGKISDDLAICNLRDTPSSRSFAIVYRIVNGNLQSLNDDKLDIVEVEGTKSLEGPLAGLELNLDPNFILTVSINEPLLSATPAPTPIPTATPFKFEPMGDPSTF